MPKLIPSERRKQMREKFKNLSPERQEEVRTLARELVRKSKSTQDLNPSTEEKQSEHPD